MSVPSAPLRAIDLNADLGEGCPWDRDLLARVSSASLCCGAHAGDPAVISETLRAARAFGVEVGAHPGFPDRAGFGRRHRQISASETTDLVRSQVANLRQLASAEGVAIRFLKPHGALYNQAQGDPEIALGVVSAARSLGLAVLGLPAGAVQSEAARQSVRFVAEGFADRRYTPDGRLVPRSEPSALLSNPAEIAAQALALVDRGIDTLCLHGDREPGVALADLLLATFQRSGIVVRSFLDGPP